MTRLHLSHLVTRLLSVWGIFLFIMLLILNFAHLIQPHPVTLHALTLDGFLASLLMGLRLVVLFLVFSTIPMRWPVTLLSFMSLTISVVAVGQFIVVLFTNSLLVSLAYLVFAASLVALVITTVFAAGETILHNPWQGGSGYFKRWGLSLLARLRQYSLPLLLSLLVFSLALPLTNSVTF